MEKGIKYVHDNVNADGTFISCEVLKDKYILQCNELEYLSLKRVILRTWRELLKRDMEIANQHENKQLSIKIEEKRSTGAL